MRASLAPYLNRLSPLWARSSIIASALKGTPLGAMVGSARGAVTIIECLIVVACAHQVSRLFWTLVTPDAISSATSSSGSERTVQSIQLPRNLIITRVDLFRSATYNSPVCVLVEPMDATAPSSAGPTTAKMYSLLARKSLMAWC